MLKKSFLLLGLVFSTTLVAEQATIDVELSQGYRRDKLDFSISGPHGKPNVISELTFKHIDIYVTGLRAKLTKDDYFLQGMVAYGIVCHGKAIDDDYLFNNRKGQFSHSTHDIPGEYTTDVALRFGKNFTCANDVVVSPHVGYSAYVQKLRFRHGEGWVMHPLSRKGKSSYTIHGLNSTYKSSWYGPELGVACKKALTSKIDLRVSYTLLFPLKYDGKGHWNLRSKHDRHFDLNNKSSKSFGNIVGAGVEWTLTPYWVLKAEYEFMKFYAKGGHMKVGSHRVPMNKAHLTSNEVRLVLGYAF